MKHDDGMDAFLHAMTKAGQDVAKKDEELRKAIDTLMVTIRQVYLGAKRAGFNEQVAAKMAVELVVGVFKGGISQ